MGLVDKNYPIFFYPNLPQSATGRASDEVVTPSGAAVQKELKKLTLEVIASLTGWQFILDAISVAGL